MEWMEVSEEAMRSPVKWRNRYLLEAMREKSQFPFGR